MALTGFGFFIFSACVVVLYFLFPAVIPKARDKQWWVLLAGSIFFYVMTGWKNIFYILITALSTYAAARLIEYLAGRKDIEKKKRTQRKKLVLVCTLVLNFGILCYFKYLNFFIAQFNRLLHGSTSQGMEFISLIVPLGISFYTFMTMGYLIDVYWEKTAAQKNFFRLLTFVCFFPQITQGPISDYRQLSGQLFSSHSFSYDRFARGSQRFIWGLLKKLVCADVAAHCTKIVFAYYPFYFGAAVLVGIFLYAIQIYADFSGYMDMMCGLCEILGIELSENFDRPYFSHSVAEYWRRWHMTLGAWFKNYIYYPVAMSKRSRKIAKAIKKKAGKRIGDAVPATLALLITWFVTGLWHGASMAYIIWGLMNGFFLILQVWLDPFYAWCRKKLHIKEDSWWWRAFTIIRTFVIISFIKVLPELGSLSAGFGLWRSVFTNMFIPDSFWAWFPYNGNVTNLIFMAVMIILIFAADIIKGKKDIRDSFNKLPMAVRILLLAFAFVTAVGFGIRTDSGDFMYANF